MTGYILLLIGTVLVNNFVLVQFLGLCPFMGVSSRTETAIGMSFATTFVMTLASLLSYLVTTTNCAVLGVALLNLRLEHNFFESIVYGFGAAAGFSLVLIMFSAMREKLVNADVPTPFKGAAIAMITAGLMSLAFMGFSGLVKM